jgi:hypothetical protein
MEQAAWRYLRPFTIVMGFGWVTRWKVVRSLGTYDGRYLKEEQK